MAQFDYYLYKKRKKDDIYLIEVQNDMLDELETRVVIPLRPLYTGQQPMRILQPTIEFASGVHYLSTSEMAAISRHELELKMGNLSEHRDKIIAAIDLLFTGF
ncbi:CcdB-like toxin protein [Magnetococcus marinus MC-1]|uniref:Toxin CcdB n=1 Tax=Magnetococcus marinus (strain ATCC BAA-1437 / JCM 17883 / MC-1) TaxID=156889 RepID=A0L723_MAGMM|nr:CcdB family protein [Magnetococcus marinus]ABK43766.1 CcdB-like toxin protein [Magnetococcus marinus MC-1]